MNNEKLNLKNKEPGKHFVYRGIEWVVLGHKQGGTLCITAELIGEMPFDKDGNNDWRKSSLRKYLNTVFLDTPIEEFGEDDSLLTIYSDLVADNGDCKYGMSADYIGLLSCNLYREFRDVIPRYETCIWTCTPWSCDPNHTNDVRVVSPIGKGALGMSISDYVCGVAPICLFY